MLGYNQVLKTEAMEAFDFLEGTAYSIKRLQRGRVKIKTCIGLDTEMNATTDSFAKRKVTPIERSAVSVRIPMGAGERRTCVHISDNWPWLKRLMVMT